MFGSCSANIAFSLAIVLWQCVGVFRIFGHFSECKQPSHIRVAFVRQFSHHVCAKVHSSPQRWFQRRGLFKVPCSKAYLSSSHPRSWCIDDQCEQKLFDRFCKSSVFNSFPQLEWHSIIMLHWKWSTFLALFCQRICYNKMSGRSCYENTIGEAVLSTVQGVTEQLVLKRRLVWLSLKIMRVVCLFNRPTLCREINAAPCTKIYKKLCW